MKKISIIEYAQKSKKNKTCHYKKKPLVNICVSRNVDYKGQKS